MKEPRNKALAIAAFALVVGLVVQTGGLAGSARLPLKAQIMGAESTQVGEIYELQAAFHRAKTTQDIDLMMSLWDVNGTLTVQGNPNSPFVGSEQIKSFWQTSGSFTHRRFSLVPSFKTQIDVNGDQAWLYFECHDVGDYDLPDRTIVSDTFLAGTVRYIGGKWVFSSMTAGKAFPLSVNHYYFP
jgi:SnoaL-like domain